MVRRQAVIYLSRDIMRIIIIVLVVQTSWCRFILYDIHCKCHVYVSLFYSYLVDIWRQSVLSYVTTGKINYIIYIHSTVFLNKFNSLFFDICYRLLICSKRSLYRFIISHINMYRHTYIGHFSCLMQIHYVLSQSYRPIFFKKENGQRTNLS